MSQLHAKLLTKFLHSKKDLPETVYLTGLLAGSCERAPMPK